MLRIPEVVYFEKIISIVDDQKDITVLFEKVLCADMAGVSIVTFNDPAIALEHFRKNEKYYAVIISDMRMPGMDGLELLKKVKALNHSVRTILISAYDFQNNPDIEKYLK